MCRQKFVSKMEKKDGFMVSNGYQSYHAASRWEWLNVFVDSGLNTDTDIIRISCLHRTLSCFTCFEETKHDTLSGLREQIWLTGIRLVQKTLTSFGKTCLAAGTPCSAYSEQIHENIRCVSIYASVY